MTAKQEYEQLCTVERILDSGEAAMLRTLKLFRAGKITKAEGQRIVRKIAGDTRHDVQATGFEVEN